MTFYSNILWAFSVIMLFSVLFLKIHWKIATAELELPNDPVLDIVKFQICSRDTVLLTISVLLFLLGFFLA
jgi:hypothetical protein